MVPVGSPSVFDAFCVCLCALVFQELTEEGIPFLILFHVKEDGESLEKFQHEVARQLISEKGKCVTQFTVLIHLYQLLYSFSSPTVRPLIHHYSV